MRSRMWLLSWCFTTIFGHRFRSGRCKVKPARPTLNLMATSETDRPVGARVAAARDPFGDPSQRH